MDGPQGRLKGKRALVTGAGTGIGREIALELARQGADVVLHYGHSEGGAVSAVEEIRAMGRRAEALSADFDSVDEVFSLGDRAVAFLGGLDFLVNNAGITFNRPYLTISPRQFDRVFGVNFKAMYFLTQKAVTDMVLHGGGAVCNISSIHALTTTPHHTVYAATKSAIAGFTRALAVELAHQGIRVNAIAAGAVVVESHFRNIPGHSDEAVREFGRSMVPLGRIGVPLDIARLAAFLCSDESAYIVGQLIAADGGSSALSSLAGSDFRKETTALFGKEYVPDS